MNLTIITINYNGSEETIKLLESLKDQTDKNFDILVIDNNSKPEQKAILKNYRTNETNVLFIENDRNLGFSGGNNVGIKKAFQNRANWVLLLNNDTWVETDFIARLKANLGAQEGLWGIPVYESGQLAYGGRIEWLKTPSEMHHIYDKNYSGKDRYVIGAGMAISRAAYEKLGPMDEHYFLYYEDTDYSVGAMKNNVPIGYCQEPMIHHGISQSTSKLGSPMLLRYHYRNAFYFNRKNGPWHIKIMVWPWSWWVAGKQILKLAVGKNREQSKAILSGVGDFYKHNYGRLHS